MFITLTGAFFVYFFCSHSVRGFNFKCVWHTFMYENHIIIMKKNHFNLRTASMKGQFRLFCFQLYKHLCLLQTLWFTRFWGKIAQFNFKSNFEFFQMTMTGILQWRLHITAIIVALNLKVSIKHSMNYHKRVTYQNAVQLCMIIQNRNLSRDDYENSYNASHRNFKIGRKK